MKRQTKLEEILNVLENVRDNNPEDENTMNKNEIYEEQTRGA